MPVADYQTYCNMFEKAREGHYAYPAFNVTSLTTANAVLKGLAESRCDGIIQVSTGGGAFASGSSVKDMALGAGLDWPNMCIGQRSDTRFTLLCILTTASGQNR